MTYNLHFVYFHSEELLDPINESIFGYIFYFVGKPELQAKSLSEKPSPPKPDASTAKQNVKDAKLNQNNGDSDSDDSDLNDSSSDDTSDDEVLQLIRHLTCFLWHL